MSIDLDNLTFGQAREIAAMLNAGSAGAAKQNPMVGKHCVVRTYSAGVHIGAVESVNGTEVLLSKSLRLWSWRGALSLSEVATKGVSTESKISVEVPTIFLTEAIELIPTTELARATYDACKSM